MTAAEQNNEKKIYEREKPDIRVTTLANDSTSLSDEEKNDVKIDETEKPNIRAGSILRPRAVLSSPGKITLLNYFDINLRLHSVISPQRKKLNLNMKCSNLNRCIIRLYKILRAFTIINHCVHPTHHHTHCM